MGEESGRCELFSLDWFAYRRNDHISIHNFSLSLNKSWAFKPANLRRRGLESIVPVDLIAKAQVRIANNVPRAFFFHSGGRLESCLELWNVFLHAIFNPFT
uniref:Uncharacterized protein n=1 Tax=Rhodosorus marinus TaxID=101924 RepID=A0A7S2ZPF0_9RHOD